MNAVKSLDHTKDVNIHGREIFGVVEALDGIHGVEIYKESKESCKPLLANGTLYLTRPSRPIKGPLYGFYVNLKDKHTNLEVGYGYYFSQQVPPSDWYSKTMSIVFRGKHGRVILYATLFSDGVAISVQVRRLSLPREIAKNTGDEDNSKSVPAIHGTLYARPIGEEEVQYWRTLFSRSADDSQGLDSNVIPLSRYLIVLPRYASFEIEADLWEETDVLGTQVQLVKDTVSFEDTNTDVFVPETTEIKKLKGVEVEVTWHSEYEGP